MQVRVNSKHKIIDTSGDFPRKYTIFTFNMERLRFVKRKDIANYVLPLIAAVNAFYRAGRVHCNLSPTKIMLNQQVLVRIVDFGRAGYVGRNVPKDKCTGEEPLTTFSADSDLATLEKPFWYLEFLREIC